MLKDANDADNANNTHNSDTGRATTASIINYRVARRFVCVSVTRTTLTAEQLIVAMFRFSTCSVHDSKSVHLHTKFLTGTTVR